MTITKPIWRQWYLRFVAVLAATLLAYSSSEVAKLIQSSRLELLNTRELGVTTLNGQIVFSSPVSPNGVVEILSYSDRRRNQISRAHVKIRPESKLVATSISTFPLDGHVEAVLGHGKHARLYVQIEGNAPPVITLFSETQDTTVSWIYFDYDKDSFLDYFCMHKFDGENIWFRLTNNGIEEVSNVSSDIKHLEEHLESTR